MHRTEVGYGHVGDLVFEKLCKVRPSYDARPVLRPPARSTDGYRVFDCWKALDLVSTLHSLAQTIESQQTAAPRGLRPPTSLEFQNITCT